MPAARASARDQSGAPVGRERGRLVGKDVESQRQQAVAGKDGGRLVEGLVHGRLAAAQIVVVHRRQIVMDQRIAVDAFERRRHAQRRMLIGAEESCALQHKERAQPLAAIEHAVPHRLKQPRRPCDLTRLDALAEQPAKQVLDCAGADFQNGLKGVG